MHSYFITLRSETMLDVKNAKRKKNLEFPFFQNPTKDKSGQQAVEDTRLFPATPHTISVAAR